MTSTLLTRGVAVLWTRSWVVRKSSSLLVPSIKSRRFWLPGRKSERSLSSKAKARREQSSGSLAVIVENDSGGIRARPRSGCKLSSHGSVGEQVRRAAGRTGGCDHLDTAVHRGCAQSGIYFL